MELGIDVSSYFDEVVNNAKYYINHQEIDPLLIFRKNNISLFRIRLWVDPKDEQGNQYGGGNNDLPSAIKLAKLALGYGYKILLDFHYSDFWADPGKQFIPKQWRSLPPEELPNKVYEYTKSVLTEFKNNNIDLHSIQIGNEITNGTLWPYARVNYNEEKDCSENIHNLFLVLSNASKACREISPLSKIIVHLESPHQTKRWLSYFRYLKEHKLDFDIVGSSYYPYWHKSFDDLKRTLDAVNSLLNKPIWVVEYAYAFTKEDYLKEKNTPNQMITRDETLYFPYPLSIMGQKDHVRDMLKLCNSLKYVEALFYWEPLWLPKETTYWATIEGEKYIHEEGKSTRNEWSNQCLYDYDGNALPALNEFKI